MASYFKKKTTDRKPSESSIALQQNVERRLKEGALIDSGISLESFRAAAAEGNDVSPEYMRAREIARGAVDAAYGEGTFEEKLTDGQRDSAIMALASADSAKTLSAAPTRAFETLQPGVAERTVGNESYTVTTFGLPQAAAGVASFDYQVERRQWSNEVFDDRNLQNYAKVAVGFHILAARQTPAAEAAYPTYAMPPDANGFEIEVERPLVFNQIWHDVKGNTIDFNRHRKLLLNAYQDHTILQNTATLVKPYWVDGDAENNAHFVDNAVVPAELYNPAKPEENFKTSWFRPGALFSLVGLAQNPELARLGQANSTDTIDHRVMLEKVLMEVKTADGTSYIPFDTKHLAYSGFNPAQEGQNRKLVLTFTTEDLTLHAGVLDHEGNTPAALATFNAQYGNYRVLLSMDIGGRINLESSETRIGGTTAEIYDIIKVTGVGVDAVVEPAEDAVVAAIKALFQSITFFGYKLEAFLTNFNRAIHGPLVTQERYKDSHVVPLGAPITAQMPVVDIANPTVDVTAPANTLMIRNSNNAFSQLFSFEKILEQAQLALNGRNAAVPQIRAIGRWLLRRSWYDAQKLVLTEEINSLQTADRNINISAGICNMLRVMVNTGYYHTNFQAAMDVLGVSAGQKPKLVLICNPIVANYIWEKGDSRTLGDGWAFDIVADADSRFIDRDQDGNPVYRIYAFFKIDGVDGPHPLNFGNMIYKPDLTTQLPITRDNRTTVEFTTQPWTLHVNHCPVLFRLDVHGLREASANSMAIKQTIV